jgi:hypothetical protein
LLTTQSAKGEGLVPTINRWVHPRLAPLLISAKLHWKEITLAVMGLSLFVSTFFVPYYSFLQAWRYYENSNTISPGGNSSFSINPGFGSTVQLMLVIGGENSLHLFAKNGQDQTVVDQTLSSGRSFFSVLSEYGTYTAFLENIGSSAQGIYWIVWIYYYNTTFQIIGITLAGLASFMLLTYKMDKEEEVQTLPVPEVKEEAKEEEKPPLSSDVVEQAKKILKELYLG